VDVTFTTLFTARRRAAAAAIYVRHHLLSIPNKPILLCSAELMPLPPCRRRVAASAQSLYLRMQTRWHRRHIRLPRRYDSTAPRYAAHVITPFSIRQDFVTCLPVASASPQWRVHGIVLSRRRCHNSVDAGNTRFERTMRVYAANRGVSGNNGRLGRGGLASPGGERG